MRHHEQDQFVLHKYVSCYKPAYFCFSLVKSITNSVQWLWLCHKELKFEERTSFTSVLTGQPCEACIISPACIFVRGHTLMHVSVNGDHCIPCMRNHIVTPLNNDACLNERWQLQFMSECVMKSMCTLNDCHTDQPLVLCQICTGDSSCIIFKWNHYVMFWAVKIASETTLLLTWTAFFLV